MAITNGYCTLAEFKAYATITSTNATDDTVIEQLIEGASRLIDTETGRTFYARTETHYFDIPNSRILRLDDDLLTVTTFTNGDGTAISSANYILMPRNKAPYFAIKLKDVATVSWQADSSGSYEGVLSIAGTWGYASSTPTNIKDACMMIAKSFYQKRSGQNVGGVAQVTAAGVVISPEGIPADARKILDYYRKVT